MKQKTVVERGDTCIKELKIRCKQPDGWWEYIPARGDEIKLYFKDDNNKIVREIQIEISENNKERVQLIFPTDLPEGKYTYDIIANLRSGERHTLCNEYIFEIKEDDAYA